MDSSDPRILRQVSEGPSTNHPTRRRIFLTTEHPEQRGLARPVAANDAHFVASHHREVG